MTTDREALDAAMREARGVVARKSMKRITSLRGNATEGEKAAWRAEHPYPGSEDDAALDAALAWAQARYAPPEPAGDEREALARILFTWDTAENWNDPTWESLTDMQRAVWLGGADAVLAAGYRHVDPPEVGDREALARIIWRVQYSDMRGYPRGGQSFAHAMADAALARGFRRVDAGVRAFIDAGRRLEDGKAVAEYAARTASGSVWYPAPNGGLPGTSADEVREHLGHRIKAGDDIVRRTRTGRDDIVTEWEVVTDE